MTDDRQRGRAPERRIGWRVVASAIAAIAAIAAVVALLAGGRIGPTGGGSQLDVTAIAVAGAGGDDDPFAYSDDLRAEFEARAASGLAHVLYAKSPGGVIVSARRTERFRPEIERLAPAGLDPDLVEAMVFLESAGRTQVIAGDDPAAAAGVAQILAETGSSLLGMRVDLARSRRLTTRLAVAARRLERIPEEIARLRARAARAKPKRARQLVHRIGRLRRARLRLPSTERRLRAERARVDQRFDPDAALAGMVRYLSLARERFGRADLAIESYHMGIGNLEDVIRAYAGRGGGPASIRETVARDGISYAKLYFDSSPLDHPATWRLLASFGDDSSTYLWRVLAAREILELYRTDRPRLRRLIALQTAKATAEEVLHPRDRTRSLADPADLRDAYEDGTLVEIPRDPTLGYRIGAQLGELAADVGAQRSLYAGLRPAAAATLIYMAARVRAISGHPNQRLIVTSAVRDRSYQDRLVGVNAEATPNYSLHTTGWSFDIRRKYGSDAQASAFQFVLDRLRALAVIDYVKEPTSIHVTVSNRAMALLELG